MSYSKVTALAIQLAFAANETREGDVEEIDGKLAGAPTRWSPLRASALWEQLPNEVQQSWLKYAQRISLFAGAGS
jgi:hypothetical protein